ncbi:MAG: PD40 domain-containing protein [Acidobacteria bacterium]|nr:PD40 domain-containing protein [Acidobacteriota bacterium]
MLLRTRRVIWISVTGAAIAAAMLTQGPSVSGQTGLTDPIVFASRAIPRPGHIGDGQNRTGSLPGVGSISRFVVANPGRLVIREPNGGLRILVDGANPTSQSLNLIDVHAPEVSYDGQWVAFAGLPNGTYDSSDRDVGAHPGAWRIYTINVSGTGLRQVTFDPPPLDLSQFPFPASYFNRADDTDPVWLPDGRIVFSSTRWPAVAQYRDPRTTNLYVVNPDGSHLHRITAERNGADRPLVDPVTGKIVYSRWWRNAHLASDNTATLPDPVYGGYLLHLGLATDDSNRYTPEQYASLGPAYGKVNRNLWISAVVNPDGTDLSLWNGGSDSNALMNTLYGGSFDEAGNIYSSLFPLENLAEVAGFGGVRYHRRGVTGQYQRPDPVLGITEFLPQIPLVFPDLERVFQSEYAAEPEVVPGTNLLVVSIAPDYRQDYGLYVVTRDGQSRQLLVDNPGTTEIRARLVRPRPLPPVIPDRPHLVTETASLLPPRATGPYDIDGTFVFDALNVYFNAPVDTNIVSAPPVGSAGSIRFYADFIKDSPTTNSRYNWPSLLGERPVAPDGSVAEPYAPANIPLFEQLRTPQAVGYGVPVTNPPNTQDFESGAAHVAGMNFGRPGTRLRCVGCHMGHTLIPVPATSEAARWTNLAPGATTTASSGSGSRSLINRRAHTEGSFDYWRSQSGQSPTNQWVQLTFPVSVYVRTVRLWGASDLSTVGNTTVQVFSDPSATSLAAQAASGPVADGGTDVGFADVPARAVRVVFSQVTGAQASLAEIEVIAAGGPGSTVPLPSAPTRLRIIVP